MNNSITGFLFCFLLLSFFLRAKKKKETLLTMHRSLLFLSPCRSFRPTLKLFKGYATTTTTTKPTMRPPIGTKRALPLTAKVTEMKLRCKLHPSSLIPLFNSLIVYRYRVRSVWTSQRKRWRLFEIGFLSAPFFIASWFKNDWHLLGVPETNHLGASWSYPCQCRTFKGPVKKRYGRFVWYVRVNGQL